MEFLFYFYVALSFILTGILAVYLLFEDLQVLYSKNKIKQGKFGYNYSKNDALYVTLLVLFFCLPFVNIFTLLFFIFMRLMRIKSKKN